MLEVLPDDRRPYTSDRTLFLAGSIEMGKALDWQSAVVEHFTNTTGVIFNPRVKKWNNDILQDCQDDRFTRQVVWEQKRLSQSKYVLVNLQAGTLSPITLHELGQLALRQDCTVVVSCPKGFWRRGNVQACCALHGFYLYENLGDALAHLSILFNYEDVR